MSARRAKGERRRVAADVNAYLHQYILEVRAIMQRAIKGGLYQRFPNMRRPCRTCAFQPSTDHWKGNDKTALNLQHALETDAPFYCHEGMAIRNGEYDPTTCTKLEYCGGWLAIVGEPDVKMATLRAVRNCGVWPEAEQ